MKQENVDELKKGTESFVATFEGTHHAVEAMKEQFKTTPEGREVAYLEQIREYYLQSVDMFLKRLVSKQADGRLGITHVIENLEHPQHGLKPDPKLVKELKIFAKRVEKAEAFNDYAIYEHYRALLEKLDSLHHTTDVHDFLSQFNMIAAETQRHPETAIAKVFKERKRKVIPATLALERYETVVLTLKLILARLFRPDQEGKARELIGHVSFEGLLENIGRMADASPEKVRKEIAEMFAQDREDDNMTNLKGFSRSVAQHGEGNILIFVLIASNHPTIKDIAKKIMESCGSGKKVKTDPETVNKIGGAIKMLSHPSMKEKFEDDAKQEFVTMLKDAVAGMEKTWKEELSDMRKLVDDRIHEITKLFSKDLDKLKQDLDDMKKLSEELILDSMRSGELHQDYSKTELDMISHMKKEVEIFKVTNAILMLDSFSQGALSFDDLLKSLDMIAKSMESKFVFENIQKIKSASVAFHENRMQRDLFMQYVEQMKTAYLGSLMKHAFDIEVRIKDFDRQLGGFEQEADRIEAELKDDMKQAARQSREYNKHLEGHRFRVEGPEELPPS